MPQCKLNNCREQAVPHGKRYCPMHLEEYKAKRRKWEELQRTLPTCEDCGGKVGPSRAEQGRTTCTDCGNRRAAENKAYAQAAAKRQAFEACTTVEALKEWIQEYLWSAE